MLGMAVLLSVGLTIPSRHAAIGAERRQLYAAEASFAVLHDGLEFPQSPQFVRFDAIAVFLGPRYVAFTTGVTGGAFLCLVLSEGVGGDFGRVFVGRAERHPV